jgi:hypothetical protein
LLEVIGSFGLEAWSQAANSKTQDNDGLEAKAGVVGRLCPPGGKEGVPEDNWETTQEIQQARALRYAG